MSGVDGRPGATCRAVGSLDAAGDNAGDANECQRTAQQRNNTGERGLGWSILDGGLQAPDLRRIPGCYSSISRPGDTGKSGGEPADKEGLQQINDHAGPVPVAVRCFTRFFDCKLLENSRFLLFVDSSVDAVTDAVGSKRDPITATNRE